MHKDLKNILCNNRRINKVTHTHNKDNIESKRIDLIFIKVVCGEHRYWLYQKTKRNLTL